MVGRTDQQLLAQLTSMLAAMQPPRALSEYSAATSADWDELFTAFGLLLGIDERVRLKTRIMAELKAGAGTT